MKQLIIVVISCLTLLSCKRDGQYIFETGHIFGTTYHIKYESEVLLDSLIQEALSGVNQSLSTYDTSSIISRINQNDTAVVTDRHFLTVYKKAMEVSDITDGAFDMTVAPLVNVWGFGFSKKENVSQKMIDSIMQFVGYKKVHLKKNKIVKDDDRIMLDASAIAKGYGVDVVANALESSGVKNYLVEIGGEVRVKGVNDKGHSWSVAIDKPIDDPLGQEHQFQDILELNNQSLASSGNYRNFYYKDGIKYAHTIQPYTGYPAQSDVLSASVIAPDCMTADAFATAFMVLGSKRSIEISDKDPDIECYLITSGADSTMNVIYTKGFEKYIKK